MTFYVYYFKERFGTNEFLEIIRSSFPGNFLLYPTCDADILFSDSPNVFIQKNSITCRPRKFKYNKEIDAVLGDKFLKTFKGIIFYGANIDWWEKYADVIVETIYDYHMKNIYEDSSTILPFAW